MSLADPTPANICRVLKKVEDEIILKDRWCQGDWSVFDGASSKVGTTCNTKFCLGGAILFESITPPVDRVKIWNESAPFAPEDLIAEHPLALATFEALTETLGSSYDPGWDDDYDEYWGDDQMRDARIEHAVETVVSWNDNISRTASEVVDLSRQTRQRLGG